MKLNYLLPILVCFLLVNCTDEKESAPEVETETSIPDLHTSRNSLDWSGTYTGTLPCASCEGIETTLELTDSLTYTLTMIYLGEDEDVTDKEIGKGTFSWNELGNTITLEDEEEPNEYFVGENYLAKLDMEEQRVTGELADKYILRKEKSETE